MANIAYPKGFIAGGGHVGIKKAKRDLTLIASEIPAVAAGCFTKNIVKAAPVIYDQNIINTGDKVRGIIINSGNANACTGESGMRDTLTMASEFAVLLNASPGEIFVCSTGVIGVPLPIEKISKGISAVFKSMGNSEAHGEKAVEGIMTTDTFMKTAIADIIIGDKVVHLAGMSKGSGMIHPDMATMLAFITTDAAINRMLLQEALSTCVDKTFNMISVDGDTSTNDTILILANGMAKNAVINTEGLEYEIFFDALLKVCESLAKDIVRDGEGATKLFEVQISGAISELDARIIARGVASSNLFKAAMFGADANWGRALCAMGYSGGKFDPAKVNMSFISLGGTLEVMRNGNPLTFSEDVAKKILSEREIIIKITLGDGQFSARAWGCDLTYDYVKINADYRS
ncbi:MAG: bifunctional ornithine acetyltransferase/N-acetylglutamate synthase [Oscillospiraceae bacterium]|nr:bifunctional ornithine acetyltransferase/N-acetylglutamate synthase [Oscillospiraceae bacterium]